MGSHRVLVTSMPQHQYTSPTTNERQEATRYKEMRTNGSNGLRTRVIKRGLIFALLSVSRLPSTRGVRRDPLVLIHDTTNSMEHSALVYIPGYAVPAERYVPLLTRLQDDMSAFNVTLHIGIVMYPQLGGREYPPFFGHNALIEQTILQVKQQAPLNRSQSEDLPIFLGGHSLGSVVAQMAAYENPGLYNGLLIHGGYVIPKYRRKRLLVPTLTVSGSRDGMNRFTYVAMQHKDIRSADPRYDFQHDPTILLEGVNHYQVASNAPPYVENRDLEPIISTEAAQSLISKLSATFLLQEMNVSVADEAILQEYVIKSQKRYFDPYIRTVVSDESGETCAFAQRLLLGGNETIAVTSRQPRNLVSFTFSKPKSNATMVNVVHFLSKAFTWFGRSSVPQAAQTLRCKMITREQIFGVASVDNDSCASLNAAIFQRALGMLPTDIQEAFWTFGSPLELGRDLEVTSGVSWLTTDLNVTLHTNGTTVVNSPRLKTSPGHGRYSGKLYCTLLPMSRAIEYITIDSIPKANGSCDNTLSAVAKN